MKTMFRYSTAKLFICTATLGLAIHNAPAQSDWASKAESVFTAPDMKVPGRKDKGGGDRYSCYREPVTVITKSGRLIVGVQAGNRLSWPERSGQDLVIRTSDNHGKTWSKPIVAAEHGNFSCQSHGLVYDAEKDRLLFLYVTYNWDYSSIQGRGYKATAPIYQKMHDEGKPAMNAYLVYSDDEGETWSKPRDITDITGGDAHFGASEGRQLTIGKHAGRLIIAGGDERNMNPTGKVINKNVGVWISDDHGENWEFSQIKPPTAPSCEGRVTELPDGSLLYIARPGNGKGRILAFSKNGGKRWSDAIVEKNLVGAKSNGSCLTLRNKKDKLTETVLCSIPCGGTKNGTIYISKDGGETWPQHKLIIPTGHFKYSAIVQLDADTIGFFYETSHYKEIKFLTIPLNDILRGDT
jgi:sialidase-1